MIEIHLIDTSVLCNVLSVPFRDQDKAKALSEFTRLVKQRGCSLLLPIATIYETGNHIAQSGTSNQRLAVAQKFVEFVQAALSAEPPWTLTPLPNHEEMGLWLAEFPFKAQAQTGLCDLSIIKTFDQQCALNPNARVRIWSYDEHLMSYDRLPTGSLAGY